MEKLKRTVNCNICFKGFESGVLFLKHLEESHNLKPINYITDNILQFEVYCPYCKKQLPFFTIIHPTIKSCKCFSKQLNPDNYSIGARKREKVFRETILEDGRSIKETISAIAAPKVSASMKKKILNGYTPKSQNRLTHNAFIYKKLKFRSSWELIFFVLNESNVQLKYEKLRLKYFDYEQKKERTYITDFIDEEKRIIYEIKPETYLAKINFVGKEEATINWCNENNFTFSMIDERYFILNLDNIKSNEILKLFDLKNAIKSLENWKKVYERTVSKLALNLLNKYHTEIRIKQFGLI